MKEIPMLFADEMVRAIIDGRKVQTRRIVDPQPQPNGGKGLAPVRPYFTTLGKWTWVLAETGMGDGTSGFFAPWQVGDVIYVRECWTPDHAAFYPHYPIIYRADGYDPRENNRPGPPGKCWSPEQNAWFKFKWRPSIHMPRRACRLLLDVTRVRCERLQDITEEYARAEGVDISGIGSPPPPMRIHQRAFKILWNSLYGKRPGCDWAANPWVFVIEFSVRAT